MINCAPVVLILKHAKHNACQVESLRVLPESPTRARVVWDPPDWLHKVNGAQSYAWHLDPPKLEYEITTVQGTSQNRFQPDPDTSTIYVGRVAGL